MSVSIYYDPRRINNRKFAAGLCDGLNCLGAVLCCKPLLRSFLILWSIYAEPNLPCLVAVGPKTGKVQEVAGVRQHRSHDNAMDNDTMARDVMENPLITCRRAPPVMFLLQSVYRYDQMKICNKLNFHVHAVKVMKQDIHFPITKKRLASHNRQMYGAVTVYQFQDTIHEIVALKFRNLPEDFSIVEVHRVIGITTRAA